MVENGLLEKFGGGGDLEEAAALRRESGYEIRTSFLRREAHLRRINERPAAKAAYFLCSYSAA